MTTATQSRNLLRIDDVLKKLSISRTTLSRLRERDKTFPKPIKDGSARSAPAYYVEQEIEAWLQAKLDSRDAA